MTSKFGSLWGGLMIDGHTHGVFVLMYECIQEEIERCVLTVCYLVQSTTLVNAFNFQFPVPDD